MKIYLIHNLIRKDSAIENIRRIFGHKCHIDEIYSQKKGSLNWINYLTTRLLLLNMEISLLRPVGGKRVAFLKIKLFIREIRNLIIFLLVENERKKLLTRAWIVYSISSKHIRAWKKISAGSESHGLIFEDDMVAKENSAMQVAELLEIVNHMRFNGYIDLAGGYQMTDLFNEAAVLNQLQSGPKLLMLQPPRSNTACGYLLSREMAKFFTEKLDQNKKTRFMPIDFIINYCLAGTNGAEYQCLHAHPSVFQHGSFLGLYKTWDV